MDPVLAGTLFGLGLLGGFLSGLLGIGGGIIMVPLLLYVPPALGLVPLGMKVVAGMTALQSFVGAVSGTVGHHRFQRVHRSLAFYVGVPMALGSLLGSVASKQLSDETLLIVFAGMALAAAIMMVIPRREEPGDVAVHQVEFNHALAVVIGLTIGLLSGVIGQGGAFLFIPAMLFLLRIPTRIAIGTALVIGIVSSSAVLLGRIGTNQIPWLWTIVLVTGVVFGAQAGSVWSQRMPRAMLKRILALIITGTAFKIWWEVI